MEAVMPDTKAETTSHAEASNRDGSAPDMDNAEGAIFDSMTPEELKSAVLERDKQYKELHSKVGQMSGELGELRKLKEQVSMDNKLASVLESVQNLTAKKDEKPVFDWDAYEAQLSEKMAENPAEATKDLLKTMNAWMTEDREKVKGEAFKEMSALKSELQKIMEVVETTTDDYKENKELIEKFRAKGMSLKDAKVMAKEIREIIPSSDQRTLPPTGVTPSRVVAHERKAEPAWSNDDVARWKNEGRSETFIEMMKVKMERDAQLTDEDRENF
jgi:uncharacterized protein YbaA (DUF1428 family)